MPIIRRRSAQAGVVLGIDQSYTGLAIVGLTYDDADPYQVVGRFPADKAGTGVDRLIAIEDWLSYIIYSLPPIRHVCMEGYASGSKFGREIAGELGAVCKLTLRAIGDPVGYPTIVTPTQVKQFALGKGRGEKSMMLKAVYQRWGFDTDDDNLADAYVMARIAQALQWGRADLLKYQQDLLTKLTRHTERHKDDHRGRG